MLAPWCSQKGWVGNTPPPSSLMKLFQVYTAFLLSATNVSQNGPPYLKPTAGFISSQSSIEIAEIVLVKTLQRVLSLVGTLRESARSSPASRLSRMYVADKWSFHSLDCSINMDRTPSDPAPPTESRELVERKESLWDQLSHRKLDNFCDLTLICDGENFRCHKMVLAAYSEVLRRTLVPSPGDHFLPHYLNIKN